MWAFAVSTTKLSDCHGFLFMFCIFYGSTNTAPKQMLSCFEYRYDIHLFPLTHWTNNGILTIYDKFKENDHTLTELLKHDMIKTW